MLAALPGRRGRVVGARGHRRRGRHRPARHIATLLPDEWLEPAATGSPATCAARVARQFDLGVDGVIMHGATPAELEPVVPAYRAIRPTGASTVLRPTRASWLLPDGWR